MRDYLDLPIAILVVGMIMVSGIYLVAVIDRVIGALVAGSPSPWRRVALGPARSAAALVLQQRTDTERPDAGGWALAAPLYLGSAAVALAMVPLAPDLVIADPATGFVVFSAAIGFVMIAVYLHGWSPNSVYPLHGAYRYSAQGLSLQIPFLVAMLATALPAESLSIVDIVAAQESVWNVARQPLGLPIYLIVGLGVSLWRPLDLPDAVDIAGGSSAEDAGASLLAWKLARASMLVAIAAMGAAGFLGGWWGPWLPGLAWTLLKTIALLVVLVTAGHLFARVRLEWFVTVAWAVLIPLSLVNIFVAGAFLI
jgi:NADH-quinone oxidoreductase subunit H